MKSFRSDLPTTAGRRSGGRTTLLAAAAWVVAGCCSAALYAGAVHFGRWEHARAPAVPVPAIRKIRPAPNATGVLANTAISADLFLPNTGVAAATMTTGHVRLFKVLPDGTELPVPGNVNTSGGGDAIVFQPRDTLDNGTKYHFACDGVKDTSDALFKPYSMTFTTAADSQVSSLPVAFEHVELPKTVGYVYSGLTIGPDGRLYAGTYEGQIFRFDILPGGQLSDPPVLIDSVRRANKASDNASGSRLITGICFDPRSTAADPVLWITHGVCKVEHCPDWSCKLSRLSGPNLGTYQDAVVALPRAYRDHLSFKIAFDPKDPSHLYFNQGSSSSTGAADRTWGLYPEHLLTAACLQVDVPAVERQMATGHPLNVKTEDDGHYDPWAADAPLKIYATGIRSGFGLLFHRNGHLYSCLNGGAEGGAAPATPDLLGDAPRRIDGKYAGPAIPGIETVTETQPDLFVDIVRGGYYGHPNETRGEYVLNGGNPDGQSDNFQVHDYKVGVKPDRNWHPATWNLGPSLSCNGLIEYQGKAFGGWLDGKILTCRYSSGKDILVLGLDKAGRVDQELSGINGMSKFIDPLDLVEDLKTGNLYVSEWGGQRLTLLRPMPDGANLSTKVFVDPRMRAATN